MFPWLFQEWHAATYGACIVAAIIAAWLWARARARRAGLLPSHIDLLVPIVVAVGMLGAYAFGRFADAATGIVAQAMVLMGSLLLGTAAGIVYALRAHIRLGILGDIVAPPLALGIGIGRLGCFFAGCCFGKVCTVPAIGVRFPDHSPAWSWQADQGLIVHGTEHSLPVFPVQLYESTLCIALAIILWKWRPRVSGQIFLALALGYAIIRFGLEFLRADNPPVFNGLTFSQALCLLVAAIATTTWIIRKRRAKEWGLALSHNASGTSPGDIVTPPPPPHPPHHA